MEFYTKLERVLFCGDYTQKRALFDELYDEFKSGCKVEDNGIIKLQNAPSYSQICTIVHPTKIKRPKVLNSNKALANIIHQVTHIEYSAIDLALDAAYRFRNMPKEYIKAWLEVALEEFEHFELLNSTLNELGYKYGDFAVHQNLYDAMILTSGSAKDRMGLVHRAMEASGLDANPFVVHKLSTTQNPVKTKLNEALKIILRDEISHVNKGDVWFKYLGGDEGYFINLLKNHIKIAPFPKVINEDARIKAGYTKSELNNLKSIFC